MDALLALALLHVIPGENQQQNVNRPAGFALIVCARLGMPPESIKNVFGSPEASGGGRLATDICFGTTLDTEFGSSGRPDQFLEPVEVRGSCEYTAGLALSLFRIVSPWTN